MLALWPGSKRVAGRNLIFEGTENLPAQNSPPPAGKAKLSLTLSEQYTSGLLALQLSRAGARLFLPREVVRFSGRDAGTNGALDDETAQQSLCRSGAGRVSGAGKPEHLNFALATPDGTYALRVRFSIIGIVWQYVRKCAMMALNMLRRWLNGEGHYQRAWLDRRG